MKMMSQITMNLKANSIFDTTANSETENKTISSKADLAEYFLEQINHESDSMSDKEKSQMRARIEAKLKSGKKLSSKEEQFLRETDPKMYLQYQRIRSMADHMSEQLKHAKTKQQANDIITTAMSSVSDKDPCKEYALAAMNETAKEFKKSPAYGRLPDKDAYLTKKKTTKLTLEEDDDTDDFDPMSWSPLQDVIDSMPTFHVSA
jgi:c-di-AMP phosphodiesterase-like protein